MIPALLCALASPLGKKGALGICATWAPWLSAKETESIMADVITLYEDENGAASCGRAISKLLGVSLDEWRQLRLGRLTPGSATEAEVIDLQKERRNARDRERRKEKRDATKQALKMKPWECLGVSRSTFYRKEFNKVWRELSALIREEEARHKNTSSH